MIISENIDDLNLTIHSIEPFLSDISFTSFAKQPQTLTLQQSLTSFTSHTPTLLLQKLSNLEIHLQSRRE